MPDLKDNGTLATLAIIGAAAVAGAVAQRRGSSARYRGNIITRSFESERVAKMVMEEIESHYVTPPFLERDGESISISAYDEWILDDAFGKAMKYREDRRHYGSWSK